MDTF
jgi:DNA-binding HxlR family transcriptional regulator